MRAFYSFGNTLDCLYSGSFGQQSVYIKPDVKNQKVITKIQNIILQNGGKIINTVKFVILIEPFTCK